MVTVILINKRRTRTSAWSWGQSVTAWFISILLRATFSGAVSFCQEQVGAVQEKANELTINQCRQSGLIAWVHTLSFISLEDADSLSSTHDGCTSILTQRITEVPHVPLDLTKDIQTQPHPSTCHCIKWSNSVPRPLTFLVCVLIDCGWFF